MFGIDRLDFQFGRQRRMNTFEDHRSFYLNDAGSRIGTYQYRSSPPLYLTRISERMAVSNQLTVSFHLKLDVVIVQALYITFVICYGSNDSHQIRTVCRHLHIFIVCPQKQLRRPSCRHYLMRCHHLTVHQPFCKQIRVVMLPVTGQFLVAHHIPYILECNDRRWHTLVGFLLFIDPCLSIFTIDKTNFLAIAIYGYILGRKRSHGIGNIHHRVRFSDKHLILFGRTLRAEHVIRQLGLTECVHDTSIERIRVITTLMVERVP